jgi:prepilin-type N-terminal cleavage/methylation domain-containing protein
METTRPDRTPTGFALIEVLAASAILVAVAVGASQVVAASIRARVEARARTAATVSAVQKMEQLRALVWSEATDMESGAVLPLSDLTTDLSTDPETAFGSGLSESPSGTLDANVPPYVDYVGADGGWIGTGNVPPPSAVYIRRWSVQALDMDPDTLVLQVRVSWSRAAAGLSWQSNQRTSDDVRIVCVKTRSAQ